jgi:aspartate 1-decarboxylase
MNFAQMTAEEAAHHRPRVAILDESNNIVRCEAGVLSRFEEMFA